MTFAYFAFGSTPANMVNFESVLDIPVHALDGGRVPALGPVKERDLAGFLTRAGKINGKLVSDIPSDASRIAFNVAAFGDQVTACAELYLSALDEFGFYSPYLTILDRPVEVEDYQPAPGGKRVRSLVFNLFNLRLQVATKTSNYTVTTSDRYLKADTSSGSVTFALPALASAGASDVVFSFHKTAAANSMILDGNGAETIDGAATKTLTANGARIDIAKIGGTWVTVRSGSMV